jgi:hypothetical protein
MSDENSSKKNLIKFTGFSQIERRSNSLVIRGLRELSDTESIVRPGGAEPAKLLFPVAFCGFSPDYSYDEMLIEFVRRELPPDYEVNSHSFVFADEMLEAARRQPFGIFFIYLNPNFWHIGGNANVYEFISSLKSEFKKPILILSNSFRYGPELKGEFEQAGADAYLIFIPPTKVSAFQEAIHTIIKTIAKERE